MFTQQIAKPSFTKSKAYGLCGTLAIATALLIGAGAVSADETAAPVAETPVFTPPAPVESQPIAETPATTTEVAQPVAETPAAPTTVTKTGDTINVENPNVEVTFPNGNGKYSPFKVEYKDINIPDDMPVNEGDKVTFDLPEEVKFQTSYEFDVHNPEKPVEPKKLPNKPVDAPKEKEAEITEVVYKNDSEPKEVANTPVYGGTLPVTGEKEGITSTLGLLVIAAGITTLGLSFKKYNEGEEE